MNGERLAQAEHCLLLVIDIQTRLAAALHDKPRKHVLKHSGMLCQAAAALNVPVIVTEQYPRGLGQTEAAVAAHLPEVQPLEKTCFSCYRSEEFATALKQYQRDQVVLCGIESHVCVLQTALQLQQAGYQVFVVEDAVASRHKRHHKNAIARMRQAGVIISNVESVMFEWLGDAKHPAFKSLSRLLR